LQHFNREREALAAERIGGAARSKPIKQASFSTESAESRLKIVREAGRKFPVT
jgi:hypothetical protein